MSILVSDGDSSFIKVILLKSIFDMTSLTCRFVDVTKTMWDYDDSTFRVVFNINPVAPSESK